MRNWFFPGALLDSWYIIFLGMFKISNWVPGPIKGAIKDRVVKLGDRWAVPNPYVKHAYSQEGEDLVVFRLLALDQFPRVGFYVDVGAHHPFRYSNTQYFYERGWRGINIDATPGGMSAFKSARPLDTNLEIAIAEKERTLTFYEFSSPELNSFNKELSEARAAVPGCKIINTRSVQTRSLKSILEEHLPVGKQIDFLSIDVEGLDLEVAHSNDWQKFRPLLVLVEDSSISSLREVFDAPISQFLEQQGYELISKTALTLIFAEKSRIASGIFGTHVR